MWKAINLLNQKEFFSKYHGIMFYIQKIPFLGRIFDNAHSWIRHLDFIITPISIIFNFITSIIFKIIYFLFMFITASYVLDIFEKKELLNNTMSVIYFITGIILLGVLRSALFFYENGRDSYIFVKMLRIDPRKYYLGNFFYFNINHTITYSLALIIFINILSLMNGLYILDEISLLGIFSLVSFISTIRYLFAFLFLKLNLSENTAKKWIYISFIITLVIYIIMLILLIAEINIDTRFLYDWKFIPISLIIVLFVTFKIIKNKNIEKIAYENLKIKDFNSANMDVETLSGTKVKVEDMKVGEKDFSNYQGIEYINKIFFFRYKKALFKKKIVGDLIKATILIILLSVQLIFADKINLYYQNNVKEISEIRKILPYLAFGLSYFMFNGEFFIKFLYHNMDKKLLKHNFYREPSNVLKGLKIRIIKLLKFHLPIFILFLSNILLAAKQGNMNVYEILRCGAFAILGYIFFTFYYLYMYYLIQPFTNEGQLKNPIMTIVPWALYMALFVMAPSENRETYLIILGIVCLLFLILGGILVYHFAPSRFKQK